MQASFIELAARRQRFSALKRLLLSLHIAELKFSIKLEIIEDFRRLVVRDVKAYDSGGEEVEFAVMDLAGIYVKELCFFVRSQYPSVQSRWKWRPSVDDDTLEEIEVWRII